MSSHFKLPDLLRNASWRRMDQKYQLSLSSALTLAPLDKVKAVVYSLENVFTPRTMCGECVAVEW